MKKVPYVSVDMAAFTLIDDALHVLLVKRSIKPFRGAWSLPGGIVNPDVDATPADTLSRKLAEKTGVVDLPYAEQVMTAAGADRDPRGWSVSMLYMTFIRPCDVAASGQAAEDARWVRYEEALALPLAFDHSLLLEAARERLAGKSLYSSLPAHIPSEPFTLRTLQRAFEEATGRDLEAKAFRRRLLDADILMEVGMVNEGRGRPAATYRLRDREAIHFFPRMLGD